MKIRLILFSLLGIAVYIVLASFNSTMVKNNPLPVERKETVHAVAPAPPAAASTKAIAPSPAPVPTPVETPSAQQTPEPPSIPQPITLPEPLISQPLIAAAAGKEQLEQLENDLAKKDQQIKQLLDAQETVAGKYRSLMEQGEAAATALTAKDDLLKETEERMNNLTAAQEKAARELKEAQATIAELKATVGKKEAAEAEAKRIFTEQAQAAKTTAEKQLQAKLIETDSLRKQVDEAAVLLRANHEELAKKDGKIKELEASEQTVKQQALDQGKQVGQLQTQLNETTAKLADLTKEFDAAGQKAKELAAAGQAKEQQLTSLQQQHQDLDKILKDKSEALTKALFTVQSLKQEISAQPQATATIQGLLDKQTQECQELRNQQAAQDKIHVKTGGELKQCQADMESASKKISEMESAQVLLQASVTDVEKKLADALESKSTLANQLKEKESAGTSDKSRLEELLVQGKALQDEKLGLASQLAAVQAELKNLLPLKAENETKTAALEKAEAQLKNLAALNTQIEELRVKNTELNTAVNQKTSALEDAAKKAEKIPALEADITGLQAQIKELSAAVDSKASAVKQLEAEKTDLTGQLKIAQEQAENTAKLKSSLDEKSSALMLAETKIQDLSGAGKQIADLETKFTEANAVAQTLQTAKQTAERKVSEAEAASVRLQETLTACNGKIKTLEADLTAAKDRIGTLEDQHELQKQQDMIPGLNQQIATLRDQLVQAENNMVEMSATLREKNEAIQAAEQNHAELQSTKDQLQQALNASQVIITELQGKIAELQKAPAQAATLPQPVLSSPGAPASDQDKDGVADQIDLCANTTAGTAVNELGCPQKSGIVLEGVNFKSGTAELLPEAMKVLDKVVASLTKHPELTIEVAGYTDAMGDSKRNLELSMARAQSVVKHLTAGGIAAARLTAIGFGKENPIADNTTAAGRSKNRRVELHPVMKN